MQYPSNDTPEPKHKTKRGKIRVALATEKSPGHLSIDPDTIRIVPAGDVDLGNPPSRR